MRGRGTQLAGSRPTSRLRAVCTLAAGAVVLMGLAPRLSAEDQPPKDLRLFYQENCARCHGTDGSATDASGKKLPGADLTDQRMQKKTKDASLVKTILRGAFFGWAMPAFKDKLTQEEAQHMVTEIVRKAEKGKPIAPQPPTVTTE